MAASLDPAGCTPPAPLQRVLSVSRQNLLAETFFSAFNGVFMALVLFISPVVAVASLGATPLELTLLIIAFPVGAFLSPLWGALGRRWGMQRLVMRTAVVANLALFLVYWVHSSTPFVLIVSVSQVLNCAMRMGQSSLYRAFYPRSIRGRALGVLLFWTYLTMVPTILVAGWALDRGAEAYRIFYPLGGLCGLVAVWHYGRLRPLRPDAPVQGGVNLRASWRSVERILAGDRPYRLFQIAFFLSGSSFFMSTHVVLLLVRRDFGFSPMQLAVWMSLVPQLLLALGSPLWGKILDRVGIVRCRLLISVLMTLYLISYFGGVFFGIPALIYLGSMLQGFSTGGGQLTWNLASSHYAPRAEDVPLYNGIHFVLNGIRGLLLPWVGSLLLVLVGAWTILAATLVSLASIPVLLHSLEGGKDQRHDHPHL